MKRLPAIGTLLAASSRLASALRSRGWNLGASKVAEQSEKPYEIEALLGLVLRLNCEELYETAPDNTPPTSP